MKNLVSDIAKSRPVANTQIDQYLMDIKSINRQLKLCGSQLKGKEVLFLGDDDHISILLRKMYNVRCTIIEIDERVINNLLLWKNKLEILDGYRVLKGNMQYTLSSQISGHTKYDYFYCNPPYSSHNNGFGIKVWISRGLELLKNGGMGLIILPINEDLGWSVKNLLYIQEFLFKNNSIVIKIDQNMHSYEATEDVGLLSSNMWISYLGNAKELFPDIKDSDMLYR